MQLQTLAPHLDVEFGIGIGSSKCGRSGCPGIWDWKSAPIPTNTNWYSSHPLPLILNAEPTPPYLLVLDCISLASCSPSFHVSCVVAFLSLPSSDGELGRPLLPPLARPRCPPPPPLRAHCPLLPPPSSYLHLWATPSSPSLLPGKPRPPPAPWMAVLDGLEEL